MNTITKRLFWDIIQCPSSMMACSQCSPIINIQDKNDFQVPEPWNGDIEKAQIMVLGLNPALDIAELFPSFDLNNNSWNTMCSKGQNWTNNYIEDFFEKRYTACCPQCGKQYANINANPVEILSKSCVHKRAKNPYWKTTIAYASAVTKTNCAIKDIVFSDIIHCKSSSSKGCVTTVKNNCVNNYFPKLLSLFITSGATDKLFAEVDNLSNTAPYSNQKKTILLVGQKSSDAISQIPQWLSIHQHTSNKIGELTWKSQIKDIVEHVFSINGTSFIIVSGLPLPSRANRSSRDVIINGTQIPNW